MLNENLCRRRCFSNVSFNDNYFKMAFCFFVAIPGPIAVYFRSSGVKSASLYTKQ